MTQSYCIFLRQKLQDSPPLKKRDRTHAALKAATAKLLEKVGYSDLRVAEIAKEAGVGTATFHDYFDNRTHIAKETMVEFIRTFWSVDTKAHGYNSAFASIYFANKKLMDIYQANAGLMRSMFQLSDSDEDFALIWRTMSTDWYNVVTRTTIKKYLPDVDAKFLFMSIYTVGGMVDEFMRGLYVYKDAPILEIIEKYDLGDDALAYYLSIMWYRSIFGKNPTEIPHEIDLHIVKHFAEKLNIVI